MSLTERLMVIGEWSLTLREDTPPEIRDALVEWGHVVVLPTRLDPRLFDDATLLSKARYTGVLLERDDKGGNRTMRLNGAGMEYHLGDGNGKGFVYETSRAYLTDTFINTLNRSGSTPYGLLRDDSAATTAIEPGTINAVAGSYTGTHIYQNQREAIRYVCDLFGAEYRVNPDGTLDAGEPSDLFTTTPTAIVVRRDAGEDPNIESVVAQKLDISSSVRDFSTKVVLLSTGVGESAIAVGTATIISNPYKDIHGNDLVRMRTVSESETTSDNAGTRASYHLGLHDEIARRMTLNALDYDVDGTFAVGDTIYVYDPETGLFDTANSVRFRGRELNPTTIRVVGLTTPVREGMGVIYRDLNGVYTDLTDWFKFESGAVKVEIGDFPRTIVPHLASTITAGRVYDEVTGVNDNLIPATPTHSGTPWPSSNYQDAEGNTHAWVIVSWNEPLNTDSSVVTDGSHYVVRWRVDGQSDYQYSTVSWGTETFQIFNLGVSTLHNIGVSAADSNGNVSPFSTDEDVTTSVDVSAPSDPAPPSVSGNPLRIQVIHDLGVAGGGSFNLESDLDHMNVYADTSPGFTLGDATFLGQMPATSAHLALGITVVAGFDMFSTALRYVKVTAVDIAGNESGASTEVTVTAELVDTLNIANLAITTAKIGDAQVTSAKIVNLVADKIATGTLSAESISIEGTGEAGSNAIIIDATGSLALIRSDNYVASTSGFQINTDGSAEFQDVTISGAITSESGSSIGFDNVTGATNTAALLIGGSGTIRSTNYVAGVSGWSIEGDGDAEFQDGIYRGTLNASDLDAGTLSVSRIGSNSIDTSKIELIAALVSSQSIESTTYTPGSAGWQIDADGSAEFNNVTVRGTIEASAGSLGSLDVDGILTFDSGGGIRTDNTGNRVELGFAFQDEVRFYNSSNAIIGQILLSSPSGNDMTFGVVDDLTITANQTLFGQGSAGAPSVSFSGNTNTGFYRLTTNEIGMALGGSRRFKFRFSANGSQILANDDNEIIEIDNVNNWLQFHVGGVEEFRVEAGKIQFNDAIVATSQMGNTASGTHKAVVWNASGFELLRFTSRRDHKENIRTLDPSFSEGIYNIPLRMFDMKSEHREGIDYYDFDQPGMIGDEVFNVFGDRGAAPDEDGIPGGWSERFMAVMMLSEIQKHQKTIEDLTARLDAIESDYNEKQL